MKQYPSISREPRYGPCYVFPKYDGSNVRVEWTKKRGFDKFGSRKVLIGSDSHLGDAIALIEQQESALVPIFEKERWERVTCFFEFYGDGSFAGLHVPGEPKVATLIDVDVYKRGQIDPRDFIALFGGYAHSAPCIGRRFNKESQDAVRAGAFEGQTFEGVVCKVPSEKKWTPPYMYKWKSEAWIARVKAQYGEKAEELL